MDIVADVRETFRRGSGAYGVLRSKDEGECLDLTDIQVHQRYETLSGTKQIFISTFINMHFRGK
jgi:hypothetical protein